MDPRAINLLNFCVKKKKKTKNKLGHRVRRACCGRTSRDDTDGDNVFGARALINDCNVVFMSNVLCLFGCIRYISYYNTSRRPDV